VPFDGEELQPSSSHAKYLYRLSFNRWIASSTDRPVTVSDVSLMISADEELQPSSSHATTSSVVTQELTELMDDIVTG
jgi:hypothetical protein